MRKTALFIGIIIAIIIAGITTSNATAATATLNPTSITAKPGDTFKITLHVNCDEGINAIIGEESDAGFNFIYDNQKLELIDRKVIDPMTDLNDGLDTISLMYIGSQTLTNNDVYEWTFKVKSDAQLSNTQFSISKINVIGLEDTETAIEGLNTTITISDSSVTPDPDPDPTPTPTPTPTPDSGSGSGSGSGSNAQPSSTSGNGSYTAGKSTDGTTAASAGKIIPKAGFAALSGLAVVGLATTGIIAYKKYNQLKGIK